MYPRSMDLAAWSPETWSAIFSGGTLVTAVAAGIIGLRQVIEARNLRIEQAQPNVVVDIEIVGSILAQIVIQNIGQTVARNVRIQFDPPLQSTLFENGEEDDITKSFILREGIKTLPPRKAYRLLYEDLPKLYDRKDLPRVYESTVTFTDSRGSKYEEVYILDLNVYFGYSSIAIYGPHETASALRDIRSEVKKWSESGGNKGLRVTTRDGDAKDERNRQRALERQASWRQHEPTEDACEGESPIVTTNNNPFERRKPIDRSSSE